VTKWDRAISIITLAVSGALLGWSLSDLTSPFVAIAMLLGVDMTLTIWAIWHYKAIRNRQAEIVTDLQRKIATDLQRIRPMVELEIKAQGDALVIRPLRPDEKETIQ